MSAKQKDAASTEPTEEEMNIQQWKIKKLIKRLENAHGNGTSMISLIIPPKDQIARYSKMLADEYGTASNIKNRVNRLSVLGAISSTQQKLKLYNKVPNNGLVIYCGTIVAEDGKKEKKVNIDFEPHKPVNTSLYLCDNKFHTEALNELLESDQKYGFIVMDGNGCLFGTLSGNAREVLYKFLVDLPKKHGRGGQSSVRFARLRVEKRHNYVRKCAELAVQFFINPTTSLPNVSGLILAGLADFKTELANSDMFDQRLQRIIVKTIDVSYGFENGFNQAIELASEALANVKFVQEKKSTLSEPPLHYITISHCRLISKFFEEIAQDSGKFCFGIRDCMYALSAGTVQTLIVWDDLNIFRYVVSLNGEDEVFYLTEAQAAAPEVFKDPKTGQDRDVKDKVLLVEYLAENYKNFGCTLQFVTDSSQEGSQFVKGFGGIGAILRYTLDFSALDNDVVDDDDLYEYDF